MKDQYYLVFIAFGITAVFFASLFVGFNELNTKVFTEQATVINKYITQNDGTTSYMINCTRALYEVKNNAYVTNCTSLYESITENQTYWFKMSFDTKTNMWNIINATLITK